MLPSARACLRPYHLCCQEQSCFVCPRAWGLSRKGAPGGTVLLVVLLCPVILSVHGCALCQLIRPCGDGHALALQYVPNAGSDGA